MPAGPALAAYTCHISVAGNGKTYAGYYSGETTQPASSGVSNAGIEAQCLLRERGLYHDTIDGRWGPNSKAAAKEFQEEMNSIGAGLTEDGLVGPKTWPYLRIYAF